MNKIKIKVKWDTDNQKVSLPKILTINPNEVSTTIADYLSDRYGFLVEAIDLLDGAEKLIDELIEIFSREIDKRNDLISYEKHFILQIITKELENRDIDELLSIKQEIAIYYSSPNEVLF